MNHEEKSESIYKNIRLLECFSGREPLGLAYDLLLGAFWSLMQIRNPIDFEKKEVDFSAEERKKLLDSIFKKDFSNVAFNDGYYYGNAAHRLIWIQERLNLLLWQCPICNFNKAVTQMPDYEIFKNQKFEHLISVHNFRKVDLEKKWQYIYPKTKSSIVELRNMFVFQKHSASGLNLDQLNQFSNQKPVEGLLDAFLEAVRLYEVISKLPNLTT